MENVCALLEELILLPLDPVTPSLVVRESVCERRKAREGKEKRGRREERSALSGNKGEEEKNVRLSFWKSVCGQKSPRGKGGKKKTEESSAD
jgi:hypothetical protein